METLGLLILSIMASYGLASFCINITEDERTRILLIAIGSMFIGFCFSFISFW